MFKKILPIIVILIIPSILVADQKADTPKELAKAVLTAFKRMILILLNII
ncbi:MAG: hypothetical protein IEMM0008_1156 [bacterium]|nr:MAG: hypothetical protein IEMM0008_1156 [bacterium]